MSIILKYIVIILLIQLMLWEKEQINVGSAAECEAESSGNTTVE